MLSVATPLPSVVGPSPIKLMPAGEGVAVQAAAPTQELPALAVVVSSLRGLHGQRQDFHSAEKRLTLQIKSVQRRTHARDGCTKPTHAKCPGVYDISSGTTEALAAGRKPFEVQRKTFEREMEKAVKTLPVYAWAKAQRGFGALGLAQIVGECGDLADYSTPAKLWKRMGVGKGHKENPGPGGDETFYFGRSPRRRSVLYCIGDCLIKAGGEYKTLYDERKVFEATKPACHRKFKEGGECYDAETNACRKSHLHMKAKRYMEKRLLKNLWRAWTGKGKEWGEA